MRTLDWSRGFKRDYKRESQTYTQSVLDGMLDACFDYLESDIPLPVSYRDHALTGRWENCRDCHLRPDLILIYAKIDAKTPYEEDTLLLLRLGSHSELFGM
jgi:mRNA interferase YafQ